MPRTVEELNDAVKALGRDSLLQRWGPGVRTDEGCSALRTLPDGSVEVIVFGRGTDRITRYPDEETAVAAEAESRLRPLPSPVELIAVEKARSLAERERIEAEVSALVEEARRTRTSLGPAVRRFLGSAGWRVAETGGALRIFDPQGGDLELTVGVDAGRYVVGRRSRGGAARPVMRSQEMADVERAVAMIVGEDARNRLHLAPVTLPWEVDRIAAGHVVRDLGGGWVALVASDGRTVEVKQVVIDAVELSHLATVPVDALVASYLAPDGAPALTQFVRS